MTELIDFKYRHTGKDNLYNNSHRHTGYEILFVHSGSGTVVMGDKAIQLIAGAIYFIDASDLHCSIPENPKHYCRSLIVLSADLVDKMCTLFDTKELTDILFKRNSGVSLITDKRQMNEIEKIFLKINTAIESKDRYTKFVLFSGFTEIMRLCSDNNGTVPLSESSIPATKAMEYINSHLSENISLDDIAGYCYVSRYYLCHQFKKKLGMTIYDYILSRRITMAQNLLKSGDMRICEISDSCGFSGPSYFSMVFKKETGQTPLQFKKTFCETPMSYRESQKVND